MQIRINSFLAQSGLCSRRKAEDFIRDGLIEVNGKVCKELSTKIDPEKDQVYFKGQLLKPEDKKIFVFYKPIKVLSSLKGQGGKLCLKDFLPESPRLFSVGRLDFMSEGLLLLTNNGNLANLLAHPKHEVAKVYEVKTSRDVSESFLRKLLEEVQLEDGPFKLDQIIQMNESSFMIKIRSGRNRILRRFFAHHKIYLKKLKRVQVGPIVLGEIEPGKMRELSSQEKEDLKRIQY